MATLIEQALARQWFYSFELPDGSTTPTYQDSDITAIHDTRWQMLQSCLDQRLGNSREGLTALDLASHQGWFSVNMARSGFASVLGIDARESHVEDSQLIRDIYRLDQLSFRQGDIHELDQEQLGQFDVVLMLGLLYHLENPVGALRTCRSLCKNLCLIEQALARQWFYSFELPDGSTTPTYQDSDITAIHDVRSENIEDHAMHAEYVEVSETVCAAIEQAKNKGGRIIAVGTTSVRSLETAAADGTLRPFSGDSRIFIYPAYEFKVIDGLITNFHLPESTLLMLVCALAGLEETRAAYRHAVREQYRFFSYGDAMLVL